MPTLGTLKLTFQVANQFLFQNFLDLSQVFVVKPHNFCSYCNYTPVFGKVKLILQF
jgi:hypothetical protein